MQRARLEEWAARVDEQVRPILARWFRRRGWAAPPAGALRQGRWEWHWTIPCSEEGTHRRISLFATLDPATELDVRVQLWEEDWSDPEGHRQEHIATVPLPPRPGALLRALDRAWRWG